MVNDLRRIRVFARSGLTRCCSKLRDVVYYHDREMQLPSLNVQGELFHCEDHNQLASIDIFI